MQSVRKWQGGGSVERKRWGGESIEERKCQRGESVEERKHWQASTRVVSMRKMLVMIMDTRWATGHTEIARLLELSLPPAAWGRSRWIRLSSTCRHTTCFFAGSWSSCIVPELALGLLTQPFELGVVPVLTWGVPWLAPFVPAWAPALALVSCSRAFRACLCAKRTERSLGVEWPIGTMDFVGVNTFLNGGDKWDPTMRYEWDTYESHHANVSLHHWSSRSASNSWTSMLKKSCLLKSPSSTRQSSSEHRNQHTSYKSNC